MKKDIQKLLSAAEKRLAEDPTGFCGITGTDAPLALRGSRSDATAEEKILHAIGVTQQGQPGYTSVALNALEVALKAIRES